MTVGFQKRLSLVSLSHQTFLLCLKTPYRTRMKKATILKPEFGVLSKTNFNSMSVSLPKLESPKERENCKLLNPKKTKKVKE